MIPMKDVDILIGSLPEQVKLYSPFDDLLCEFVGSFSKAVLHDTKAKQMPDVISLGYWCRAANIQKMKEKCTDRQERLGRGVAFHVTPSNIPVNFAFSFFFSLLAGNANIVRVPSKVTPERECIIRILKEVLEPYKEIKKRTMFVSYPAKSDATEFFSRLSDVRIIWGGDETIEAIRLHPAKPRCVDITFADRYSLALINGKYVLEADEKEIQRLARAFYNDTFYMDQNACSSPQLILWQNTCKEAKNKFWDAVYSYTQKHYIFPAIEAVNKYCRVCENIIDSDSIDSIVTKGNVIIREKLKALLPDEMLLFRGRCGQFFEYDLEDISEINGIVNEKYQTLSYYGYNPKKIQKWIVREGLTGIDRIVPIGKTMEIGIVWDGYNLTESLSRIISAE